MYMLSTVCVKPTVYKMTVRMYNKRIKVKQTIVLTTLVLFGIYFSSILNMLNDVSKKKVGYFRFCSF